VNKEMNEMVVGCLKKMGAAGRGVVGYGIGFVCCPGDACVIWTRSLNTMAVITLA